MRYKGLSDFLKQFGALMDSSTVPTGKLRKALGSLAVQMGVTFKKGETVKKVEVPGGSYIP